MSPRIPISNRVRLGDPSAIIVQRGPEFRDCSGTVSQKNGWSTNKNKTHTHKKKQNYSGGVEGGHGEVSAHRLGTTRGANDDDGIPPDLSQDTGHHSRDRTDDVIRNEEARRTHRA